jgi:heme/copper-type cytochrome/quinol oxidase subunit 1
LLFLFIKKEGGYVMLIFGLTLVFLAMLIAGFIGLRQKKSDYLDHDIDYAMISIGGIFVLILWALVGFIYVGNTINIKKLQTFKDHNVQNYAVTVSETRILLSEKEFRNVLVEGSLEKMQVGAEVSKRLVEWRDKVNDYNLNVASIRVIRDLWVLPGFLVMPEIPDDLVPIVIEK